VRAASRLDLLDARSLLDENFAGRMEEPFRQRESRDPGLGIRASLLGKHTTLLSPVNAAASGRMYPAVPGKCQQRALDGQVFQPRVDYFCSSEP